MERLTPFFQNNTLRATACAADILLMTAAGFFFSLITVGTFVIVAGVSIFLAVVFPSLSRHAVSFIARHKGTITEGEYTGFA